MPLRKSPSGPPVVPTVSGITQPQITEPDYAPTIATPSSKILVLRPPLHEAGQYVVALSPVVLSAGFTTVTPTLSWSAPSAGAQSIPLGTFSPTALGAVLLAVTSIESDGVSPILLVCSASSPIFGTPKIDLYASATRVGE